MVFAVWAKQPLVPLAIYICLYNKALIQAAVFKKRVWYIHCRGRKCKDRLVTMLILKHFLVFSFRVVVQYYCCMFLCTHHTHPMCTSSMYISVTTRMMMMMSPHPARTNFGADFIATMGKKKVQRPPSDASCGKMKILSRSFQIQATIFVACIRCAPPWVWKTRLWNSFRGGVLPYHPCGRVHMMVCRAFLLLGGGGNRIVPFWLEM